MVEDGSNPEANSMPGTGRFPSVVGWFDYVRAEGYNVPFRCRTASASLGDVWG